MRCRASSYADTNSDLAPESYGIRHEYPSVNGHTNRYAGAANADGANTSGSNANWGAYAHATSYCVSDTDRGTGARVA